MRDPQDPLQVLVRKRRGGKTTEAIHWILEEPEGETRVLVSANKMMRDLAFEFARKIDPTIKQGHFQVAGVPAIQLRGCKNVVVVLDDIEAYLGANMGVPYTLHGVTISGAVARDFS